MARAWSDREHGKCFDEFHRAHECSAKGAVSLSNRLKIGPRKFSSRRINMDHIPLLSKLLRWVIVAAAAFCSDAALAQPDLILDEAGPSNLRTDTKSINSAGLPDLVVPEINEVHFTSFMPNDADVSYELSDFLWAAPPASDTGFQFRRTSFGVGSCASGALGSNASIACFQTSLVNADLILECMSIPAIAAAGLGA